MCAEIFGAWNHVGLHNFASWKLVEFFWGFCYQCLCIKSQKYPTIKKFWNWYARRFIVQVTTLYTILTFLSFQEPPNTWVCANKVQLSSLLLLQWCHLSMSFVTTMELNVHMIPFDFCGSSSWISSRDHWYFWDPTRILHCNFAHSIEFDFIFWYSPGGIKRELKTIISAIKFFSISKACLSSFFRALKVSSISKLKANICWVCLQKCNKIPRSSL